MIFEIKLHAKLNTMLLSKKFTKFTERKQLSAYFLNSSLTIAFDLAWNCNGGQCVHVKGKIRKQPNFLNAN